MHLRYRYRSEIEFLSADLQRFVDFLKENGVEAVSELQIRCSPWISDKRLQCVDEHGQAITLAFHLEPGDERYVPRDQLQDETS